MKRNNFTHLANAANCSRLFVSTLLLVLSAAVSNAQITVNSNQTAAALAQELVGTGVIVLNPTLTCPTLANGIFVVTSSNLGLDSGVVLSSGYAATVGSQYGTNSAATNFASYGFGAAGDADLATLTNGNSTHDACVLEFDFVPAGDTIKFDYVFGSEEYPGYTCSSFDDAFGFFISGPGYAAVTNIALVPGTNIPVSINSVNSGTASSGYSISTCNAVGPGSPFPAYFRNNTSSTSVTYDGLTVVMTAIAAVTPCDTYHLKLGVCDASDDVYDSGVWLKAGSLNSVNTGVFSVGGGGLTQPVNYCVRGCQPGEFVFTRAVAKPTPLVIHFLIAGTAVNGSDYTLIPDSVIIPAGDTSVILDIQGINEPIPLGPKTVMLYIYSPYACAGTTAPIFDSTLMTIYDSIYVQILNNDTSICKYDSIQLSVFTDSILNVQWIPATGLSDPFSRTPWAKPLATTTYQVVVNMPLSGCYPAHDSVTIGINLAPTVDLGPDKTICLGMSVPFNPVISPSNQTYTYLWSPGTYLSGTTILNPVSTPTAIGNTQYVLRVSPTAIGCDGYDTVKIITLPNDFSLFNPDTSICLGNTIQVRANGSDSFTYVWSPTVGVSNISVINPSIKPDTTAIYTITGTYPGCPTMAHSFNIDVQPNPFVIIGSDRTLCEWDTIHIISSVSPGWYKNYSYSWTPVINLETSTTTNVIYNGDSSSTVILTVTTPAGCKGIDSIHVLVHPGNFGQLLSFADTAVCPLATPLQIQAAGAVSYQWSPDYFIDNPALSGPSVIPAASILYTGLLTDQYGCHDTLYANIIVNPRAVLELPDSVTLYPGESYQMDPQGNGSKYKWFPPLGLSSDSISNPVAMPSVNTIYYVTVTTESNCTLTDSIKVYVDPETLLNVPNAFVPGNGPDGELKIIKRGIATLKYFRIFNRWGQDVFSTTDIDKGWDGKYNGTPQPLGVYVYEVEAYTNTGRQFVKQGNVTLIR